MCETPAKNILQKSSLMNLIIFHVSLLFKAVHIWSLHSAANSWSNNTHFVSISFLERTLYIKYLFTLNSAVVFPKSNVSKLTETKSSKNINSSYQCHLDLKPPPLSVFTGLGIKVIQTFLWSFIIVLRLLKMINTVTFSYRKCNNLYYKAKVRNKVWK